MKFGIQILQKAQRSSIRMMLKFADIQKKIDHQDAPKTMLRNSCDFNQVHFFLEK